ncbi:hypothetical protein GCM10008986_28580 [Salinibacillus aidingensis]|uniref:Uncharacterized protein n=1 Tax=Salinibacillus aidingensis TaxID=237684 RepID=A0ABN1BK17_9BACI
MIGVGTAATERYFAFRGRLVSLLVLSHCGVSPRPSSHDEQDVLVSALAQDVPLLADQESTYLSSAKVAYHPVYD